MIQSDDGDDLLMREKNRMYGADMGNVIALYILSFFSDLWYNLPVNEKMEHKTER